MSNNSNSFVRHEMLEERAPPVGEGGVLKWVRENLFSSVFNTIMTIIAVWVIYSITVGVAPWFLNGVWNAETTRECYEILDGVNGACFAVLQERFPQLIYGFKYPSAEYWRPNLATILLLVALAPVLFRRLPKRLLVFTVIYPFLAYWLIWGGSVLIPTVAFIGCCVGGVCYKRFSSGAFATAIILNLKIRFCWALMKLRPTDTQTICFHFINSMESVIP